MSTSPANADDSLSHAAQSLPCAKGQAIPSAPASVADFARAHAAGHPAESKSDDAESAQMPADIAATEPHVQRRHRRHRSAPHGLSTHSATVMSSGGYDQGYMRTPMLRRRGHGLAGVKKLLVTSAIGATLAGGVSVEIWFLIGDSDLAGPPQLTLRPALPQAPAPELNALMTAREAARAAAPQSTASLQPARQQDGQQAESTSEAPLAHTAAGSAFENTMASAAGMPEAPRFAMPQLTARSRPEPRTIAHAQPITTLEPPFIATPTPIEKTEPPRTAAPEPRSTATSDSTPIAKPEPTPTTTSTSEPHAIATAQSTWIGRLGPALESPRINQTPPGLGKAGAGLQFKDSNVRYLSRAELQLLSADQLHISRNEIFARRGRFFKDEPLRAYFLQFAWYRPYAWEVPLSPVEQANVALIQSVEEAAVGSAQSNEAHVTASRGIAGPLPAQTKAENGEPFVDPGHRYLTSEQLQGLSADQLAIVRNQIFARRGRYFKDEWLRAYFSQFPWYRPYAWEVSLSPLEQANVKLVHSLEQTAAGPRPAARTWRGPPN